MINNLKDIGIKELLEVISVKQKKNFKINKLANKLDINNVDQVVLLITGFVVKWFLM